jgi:hypothetical protein
MLIKAVRAGSQSPAVLRSPFGASPTGGRLGAMTPPSLDRLAWWRVRVDLFAEDRKGHRVSACVDTLKELLARSMDDQRDGVGGDQGDGATGRPVVGLLFWVRAEDVGDAAVRALELARLAGENHGVGPDLYDVVVIPSSAVVSPDDAAYPQMPD